MIPGQEPSRQFDAFESIDRIKNQLSKCTENKVECISKSIKQTMMDALSLPWGNSAIFSPVKTTRRSKADTSSNDFKWTNAILLIGDFSRDFSKDNAKNMLTNMIMKNLRAQNISLVHISDKFDSSIFLPESVRCLKADDYPTKVHNLISNINIEYIVFHNTENT